MAGPTGGSPRVLHKISAFTFGYQYSKKLTNLGQMSSWTVLLMLTVQVEGHHHHTLHLYFFSLLSVKSPPFLPYRTTSLLFTFIRPSLPPLARIHPAPLSDKPIRVELQWRTPPLLSLP